MSLPATGSARAASAAAFLAAAAARAPRATRAVASRASTLRRALVKALVIGLLQRIRNRRVVVELTLRRARGGLEGTLVESLLKRVRDRCVVADVALLAFFPDRTLVEGLLQRVRDVVEVGRLGRHVVMVVLELVLARLQRCIAKALVQVVLAAASLLDDDLRFVRARLCGLSGFTGFTGFAYFAWLARFTPRLRRPRFAIAVARLAASGRPVAAVTLISRLPLFLLRAAALPVGIAAAFAQARHHAQQLDVVRRQIHRRAALQAARQHHRAVADADQPTHGQADGVEQPPHLAIAALRDLDAVPMVRAFAAAVFTAQKGRSLAFDRHPRQQARALLVGQRAEHAHRVLALDAETRVHQAVGELTRGREQQQAFGVDVESADRLPFAVQQTWQAAEHRRPAFRVINGHHFADRLVVSQHARGQRRDAHAHRLTVDRHLVAP